MNRLLRVATHSRLRLTLGVVLVLALASPLGAFAYFTSAGAGIDSAVAGTLAPPTNVVVPSTTTGTVHVAWTASATGPKAIAPTGYYVERSSGGAAWTAACGSSPAALVSATDCDDAPSGDGDYTYRVTAGFRSWTTTSGTSSSVSVDSTPPTPAIALASPGPYNKAG